MCSGLLSHCSYGHFIIFHIYEWTGSDYSYDVLGLHLTGINLSDAILHQHYFACVFI